MPDRWQIEEVESELQGYLDDNSEWDLIAAQSATTQHKEPSDD